MKRVPFPWQSVFSIVEISNLLKKEKPSTLFLCSTTAGLLGSLAAFLHRFRASGHKFQVIYRIGGWAFRDPRPFWINKVVFWAEKITAPLKDKIIVNSESDRKIAVERRLCSPEKIVKIYNGINPDQLEFLPKETARQELFKTLPKAYNVKLETILIGTVANFYKTKGLKYLIEAAHVLNTDFKILIIGEGRHRAKLEELIKKYHLQGTVLLAGRIPEAFKYLKAFDIFVLPSLKEGFPWIILEVIASGTPIIATSVGALPEIIEDKKEGILLPPKSSEQLAKKILELINNPEISLRLKNQAKEKLKQFSLQKMVKETEQLF